MIRHLNGSPLNRFERILLLATETHVVWKHGVLARERRVDEPKILAELAPLKVDVVGKNGEKLVYYPLVVPASTATQTTTGEGRTGGRWRYYFRQQRDRAIDIEMTGYAVQILTAFEKIAEALPSVKWLGSKRRNNGGFISSTDTVVALDAMGGFSAKLSAAAAEATTKVRLLWSDASTLFNGSPTVVELTQMTLSVMNSDLLQTSGNLAKASPRFAAALVAASAAEESSSSVKRSTITAYTITVSDRTPPHDTSSPA